MHEYWYRFEDKLVSVCIDPDADQYASRLDVTLYRYKVTSYTAKGVWLSHFFTGAKDRFVLNGARKKFACPTIELAKESFLARKNKQISIYQNRIDHAQEAIFKATHYDWSKLWPSG